MRSGAAAAQGAAQGMRVGRPAGFVSRLSSSVTSCGHKGVGGARGLAPPTPLLVGCWWGWVGEVGAGDGVVISCRVCNV